MSEFLDDAREEIKRADHLIFVSLKYTRTCDVIKHIVDRLINTLDFTFNALLEHKKENGEIDLIPTAPLPKITFMKELCSEDEKICEFADLFLKLRKIARADFTRAREFRRHVTMTVTVDDELIELNIDNITEYFKQTKDFYEHIHKLLLPVKE